ELFARGNLALALLRIGEPERALPEYRTFVEKARSPRIIGFIIADVEDLIEAQPDTPGAQEALEMLQEAAKALEE
ncbi:MAG: hypothetical protein ACE5NP_13500, partial [Anaerolineae bacterium]